MILLTLDGVRSYEFFHGTALSHGLELKLRDQGRIFKKLWSNHAQDGMVLGAHKNYKIASSVAVSLPSYQALMLGRATACKDNHCPPVQQETVLEHVKRSMGLEKKEVAAFASWEGLSSAVAMNKDQITHGIFPDIFNDERADASMVSLQQKALLDLPSWKESRKDKYTFELGMEYLKKHCPRLLYISLVDSDEYGHAKDYPGYVNSLRTYDDYIDQVIQTLKGLGTYGSQTTLIVTTDHSRGKGPLWIGHAYTPDSEKHVFLFAHGRGVKPVGQSRQKAGHQNIRPTIEYLMGLAPSGEILPNVQVD